jgi:hypothetical protein
MYKSKQACRTIQSNCASVPYLPNGFNRGSICWLYVGRIRCGYRLHPNDRKRSETSLWSTDDTACHLSWLRHIFKRLVGLSNLYLQLAMVLSDLR